MAPGPQFDAYEPGMEPGSVRGDRARGEMYANLLQIKAEIEAVEADLRKPHDPSERKALEDKLAKLKSDQEFGNEERSRVHAHLRRTNQGNTANDK